MRFGVRVNVKVDGASYEAEASLNHTEDGSIVVQLFPSQQVPLVENIHLVGIPSTSTEWGLNPVQAWVLINGFPEGSSKYTIKARVPFADMYLSSALSSDVVTASFIITGIPASVPHFNCLAEPFTIDVDNYAFRFTAANRSEFSHVVSVAGIPYGSLDDVTNKMRDICWLLSFATGALCGIRSLEVYIGTDCVRRCLYDVAQAFETQPYVIPAEDVSRFLTQTYPRFAHFSSKYSMRALIHLGLLAKREPIVNVKALIMANWLEVLRYHFARNVGVPKGYYTYDPHDDTFYEATTGKRASFERILTDFTTHHNISGWTADFKDFRNIVVHTGALALSDLPTRYRHLHHFCDRIILALLDWDEQAGKYVPHDRPVLTGPRRFGQNVVPFTR